MKSFCKTLETLNTNSKYCEWFSVRKGFSLPGLTIEAIGEIPFPIPTKTANELTNSLSKFNNANSNNCIELPCSKFKITNPEWAKTIEIFVTNTARSLSIGSAIVAQLQKFVLVGSGGFYDFDASSSPAGTFAALQIILPSKFEGGQVAVYNNEQKKEFALSPFGLYTFQSITHYRNCKTFMDKVESGYISLLVYTLKLLDPNLPIPQALSFTSEIDTLRSILITEIIEPTAPFWVFVLDHTIKVGESFTLNQKDKIIVDIILKACEKTEGYNATSGILVHSQIGAKSTTGIQQCFPLVGNTVDYVAKLSLIDQKYLLPADYFLKTLQPSNDTTHNSSKERLYLRPAVVVWHSSRIFQLIVETSSLAELESTIQNSLEQNNAQAALECINVALDHPRFVRTSSLLPKLIVELQSLELAAKLLLLPQKSKEEFIVSLHSTCDHHKIFSMVIQLLPKTTINLANLIIQLIESKMSTAAAPFAELLSMTTKLWSPDFYVVVAAYFIKKDYEGLNRTLKNMIVAADPKLVLFNLEAVFSIYGEVMWKVDVFRQAWSSIKQGLEMVIFKPPRSCSCSVCEQLDQFYKNAASFALFQTKGIPDLVHFFSQVANFVTVELGAGKITLKKQMAESPYKQRWEGITPNPVLFEETPVNNRSSSIVSLNLNE